MNYNVTENVNSHGFHILELTEEPFVGVKFFFEDVSFVDGEEPVMKFTYTITEGEEKVTGTTEIFQNLIGDILLNIIEQQLQNNEVVYANGTDEPNQL